VPLSSVGVCGNSWDVLEGSGKMNFKLSSDCKQLNLRCGYQANFQLTNKTEKREKCLLLDKIYDIQES